MKKWEHLVVERLSQHDLNKHGKDGWELVSVLSEFTTPGESISGIAPRGTYVAFLKRELVEKAEKEDAE